MKKLLLSTAVLLLGLLAHSQEADDLGNDNAGASVVARAEYSYSDSENNHLGNSSLYFVGDGVLSSRLSFSTQLHLLSSDPGSLYTTHLRSDSSDWLDWAYFNYDFGPVDISLGKTPIFIGTWEEQDYDFNIFNEFATNTWQNVQVYQWGGSLNISPHDDFFISAQATTSPFGEEPFASHLFAYGLSFGTDVYGGVFKDVYSFNFIQKADRTFLKLFNAGLNLNLGIWSLYFDATIDFFSYMLPNSKHLRVDCAFSDKCCLTAHAGLDNVGEDWGWDTNKWYGGLLFAWTPVESLRFHALGAYDNNLSSVTFNAGLTWTISL